jgi:hypothetical protein
MAEVAELSTHGWSSRQRIDAFLAALHTGATACQFTIH